MDRVWDENWFGSTKTLDVHVRWLRGKLGRRPRTRRTSTRCAASASASARPRSPRVSLRTRLLLALAYVLLLAIVALEVPLALNLRDRVDGEVKSQALSQAEVAAATASGQLRRPDELRRIVGTIARSARGRVIITDRRGVLVADSDGAAQLGVSYAQPPGDRGRAAAATVPGHAQSDTLNAGDPRHRRAGPERTAASRARCA